MSASIRFLRAFAVHLWLLAPIWGVLALLVTTLGLALAVAENLPWDRAVYFAWITATTVGYGDITPQTAVGRALCVATALVGLVFTGVVVAIAVYSARVVVVASHHGERIHRVIDEHETLTHATEPHGSGRHD